MLEGDFDWCSEGCVGGFGKNSRHHRRHHGLIFACNCIIEGRFQNSCQIVVTHDGHSLWSSSYNDIEVKIKMKKYSN